MNDENSDIAGEPERRYKRGKRMLRVSGKHLRIYSDGEQIQAQGQNRN
jgi:hypothetical protein